MNRRRIISFLLLTVYAAAVAWNAAGVLSCDCTAHHRHDACCHAEHDRHDHGCTQHCDEPEGMAAFAAHCECSHSHDNGDPFTVDSDDTARILKSINLSLADMRQPYAVTVTAAPAVTGMHGVFRDEPVCAGPPLNPLHAPRAPSVLA